MRNLVHHVKDAYIYRACDRASPAADTEIYPETFLVIDKLMHGSLTPATVFDRPGIMSAGHQCEISIVTGIITLIPEACVFHLLI